MNGWPYHSAMPYRVFVMAERYPENTGRGVMISSDIRA